MASFISVKCEREQEGYTKDYMKKTSLNVRGDLVINIDRIKDFGIRYCTEKLFPFQKESLFETYSNGEVAVYGYELVLTLDDNKVISIRKNTLKTVCKLHEVILTFLVDYACSHNGIIRLSDEENIEVVDIMNEYLAQRKLMFSDNGAKENEDSKKLYNLYSKKLSDYLSTLKDEWEEKL